MRLAECIESVRRQTYENWIYVIADNCSTDRTEEIARGFAALDSRIAYRRYDEFVSAVASHNRAVTATPTEARYCKVLGSDDWLYPECLASMVELAERHPSVGVVASYRLANTRVDLTGIPYDHAVEPGREIVARSMRFSLEERRLSVVGSPSALLLRSDLIRQREPFYVEGLRHADTEAIYWALLRSDLGFVHQVLTFSREPDHSETTASNRLGSAFPERILFLAQYGRETLAPDEYRTELHIQARQYLVFQAKRRLKPTNIARDAYRTYHRHMLDMILAETSDDAYVRRVLGCVRALLLDRPL